MHYKIILEFSKRCLILLEILLKKSLKNLYYFIDENLLNQTHKSYFVYFLRENDDSCATEL